MPVGAGRRMEKSQARRHVAGHLQGVGLKLGVGTFWALSLTRSTIDRAYPVADRTGDQQPDRGSTTTLLAKI